MREYGKERLKADSYSRAAGNGGQRALSGKCSFQFHFHYQGILTRAPHVLSPLSEL